MKARYITIFSFLIILIFPQYAFSLESPSQSSNGTAPANNSTTNTPTIFKPTNSSLVTNNTSHATIPPTNQTATNGTRSLITNSTTPVPISVTVSVTPNLVTINQGSQITFSVTVVDTAQSTIPTGTVSWSDGNKSGTFSPPSCTLSSGNCTTSYLPASNAPTSITISASYNGDKTHSAGAGASTLTINIPHSTSLSLAPNPATTNQGSQVIFSVTVADVSGTPTTPTGTVSWDDGNAGGSFSLSSCSLLSGSCTVSYTPESHHTASILITARYNGNDTHLANAATRTLTINLLHDTTIIISPSATTINQGSQVTLTGKVADTIGASTIPTGTETWGDNVGGTFSSTSCVVSAGSCSVSYSPPASYAGKIVITANYLGDSNHSSSTTKSNITVNIPHDTALSITPYSTTINQGSQVTFTATVSDTSLTPSTPTGTVLWSDNNAGGRFSTTSCSLSAGSCSTTYAPANSETSITIKASYQGDTTHSASSGTTQLSIHSLPTLFLLSADQTYYAYGDVVTLSVNIPGQSLQNVAIGVTDPNGDNMISRTVTTDENGTGSLQFKIPDSYQTGLYQVDTTLLDGRNYSNSTQFTVIKSHGVSIDSVQITNQQGNSTSYLKKNQNGFVRVSLSSDEKMPALLTLNLFDSNQNSLGTASIKSVIAPGKSEVTLSFFISSDAQVGLANVFTDAYSDWPSNGGTPLTTESCLAADLQDPTTLPASYAPSPPRSCTSQTGNGITNGQSVKMTNDQAVVTLGIAIQNDSMTFMSPAQAHLLALAYSKNNTTNAKNSVELLSYNLGNTGNANPSGTSGNVTKIGQVQFTTLAGPDLLNNPMAVKILQEIEASKRQVANILGNETEAKLNQQLVAQQRQAAAATLKQDLTTLEKLSADNTSNAAYARFLKTVSDNRTQAVFQSEFDFMKQRVSTANTAMQNVLDNGGSWDQAVQTFYKYAKISHAQVVSLNNQLNVAYGIADSRIQSCFDMMGNLPVVNGVNQCVENIENNSTGPSGISIVSVQPTDQQGNPVSLLKRGQTGYVKVIMDSSASPQSLVTINIFDSNISSLGTVSAQYRLNPGQSEVVLPYHVSSQSATGLASIYANVFTDWPAKGGTSQSNELSYFVGIS